MKLAAVALLLVSAQSANAISLRFKFKTFSSGPSIYACNSGIRVVAQQNKVCYNQVTGNACTPNSCAPNDNLCHTQCVCSGTDGGDTLMNYMKVSYSPWTDHASAGNSGRTGAGDYVTQNVTRSSADNGAWNPLFNDEDDAYKNRIGDLSFNLGSELYNAEYFVDICYRGPQIEYDADGVVANFAIKAQVSATDFLNSAIGHENDGTGAVGSGGLEAATGTLKYTQLSGLQVKAYVVCDQQGRGNIQNAANNQGFYDTISNEAKFKFDASRNTDVLEGDLFKVGAPVSTSTPGVSDFGNSALNIRFNGLQSANAESQWLNVYNTNTPRFCKVRYVFTETNGIQPVSASNNLKFNLRKWQRHGAELCTYTDIEEAQ